MRRPSARGALVIEGRAGQQASLCVEIDGASPRIVDLSAGRVTVPVPPGGDKIRVRLSKSGPHYPEVCAVATMDAGS